MTTNLSVNTVNAAPMTTTEASKGQKTNAHLLSQPIKDSIEISGKKNDKKDNIYTATKKFAELTKNHRNAGVMSNLKFAKYYAQDKIDVPTVEKLAPTTDFDVDSMSLVYTTGKKFNNNKLADKIVERAIEYNKKDDAKLKEYNRKKGTLDGPSAKEFFYDEEKSTYGIIHTEGNTDVIRENFDAKTNKLVETIDLSHHYKNALQYVTDALESCPKPYYL